MENPIIRFDSDYTEGALPQILARLSETNLEQTTGYGEDIYCAQAAARVRELCGAPQAAVHFVVGGTQCNLVVTAAALRPHQGVVCADTGHINVHESGAIEATGHKVLALPGVNGKLTADAVANCCAAHLADVSREHMVQPRLVYVSQPTEVGTLYSAQELRALREVCDLYGLMLYVDGARLAYALGAPENDVTLPLLAELCDAFYIGGTKCGALFGEALVLLNPMLRQDFRYILKQRVGRLAKGRLMGLQFLELLDGDTYQRIGARADAQALHIRQALSARGCRFLLDSPTNQQFPILRDTALAMLSQKFVFSYWQRVDPERSAVRVCTSWATSDAAVQSLLQELGA